MANKLISELAAMTDVDVNVIIEVQHPAQSLTKKLTLSELSTLLDASSNLASRVSTLETTVNTTDEARLTAIETALGSYKIIASGSDHVGDIGTGSGTDKTYNITPDATDTDYIVLGSFYSVGTASKDVLQNWAVITKSVSSFTVKFKEIVADTQDVWFYYIVIEL